jgi:DNA-binding PadR family transcriptional regulator
MIKYILLGYLNYQSMTGYELKQNLDHTVSHFWHAHHSQIYTTLHKLDQDGLLTSEIHEQNSSPDRRVYTITEAGHKSLQDWLNQPMTGTSPIKEEFMVRLFFSANRNPQEVNAEIIIQRKLHEEKLNVYFQLKEHLENNVKVEHPQFTRDVSFWLATLKMGIRFEMNYIEWLNATLDELNNLPS